MITNYDAFIERLRVTGRMKLLPQVLRELKEAAVRERAVAPKLEVAHEKDEAHAKKAAKAEGIEIGHTKVNRELISGWRLRSGGTLIDQSAKQALIDLYQQVTSEKI